jgi:hypothetical protein
MDCTDLWGTAPKAFVAGFGSPLKRFPYFRASTLQRFNDVTV